MESEREQSLRIAREAIEYAHAAMSILSHVLKDMQKKNTLQPASKTAILDVLRELPLAHQESGVAIERMLRNLKNTTALEREDKRERPR